MSQTTDTPASVDTALTWQAPERTGGAAVASYSVWVLTPAGVRTRTKLPATARTATVAVPDGATCWVTAENRYGSSPAALVHTVRVPKAPKLRVVPVPEGLRVEASDPGGDYASLSLRVYPSDGPVFTATLDGVTLPTVVTTDSQGAPLGVGVNYFVQAIAHPAGGGAGSAGPSSDPVPSTFTGHYPPWIEYYDPAYSLGLVPHFSLTSVFSSYLNYGDHHARWTVNARQYFKRVWMNVCRADGPPIYTFEPSISNAGISGIEFAGGVVLGEYYWELCTASDGTGVLTSSDGLSRHVIPYDPPEQNNPE